MVAPRGVAVSYEQGSPVTLPRDALTFNAVKTHVQGTLAHKKDLPPGITIGSYGGV